MDKKTIDTYNKLAKEYDEETKGFWDKFPYTFIDNFKASIKGDKILNLGSGPGRDALILKESGFNIVCLDASESMVDICRNKGLESILADFLSIPFADDSFDGVWAYTSLLHISKNQINQSLSEIKRVMKRDGVLGLGMIEGSGEEYRNSKGVLEARLFSFYTQKGLEEILKENGFEIFYFDKFQPRNSYYLNFLARNKK